MSEQKYKPHLFYLRLSITVTSNLAASSKTTFTIMKVSFEPPFLNCREGLIMTRNLGAVGLKDMSLKTITEHGNSWGGLALFGNNWTKKTRIEIEEGNGLARWWLCTKKDANTTENTTEEEELMIKRLKTQLVGKAVMKINVYKCLI